MQNILNGRERTMQTQGKCSQQKVQPRKGEKMRAEMVCGANFPATTTCLPVQSHAQFEF